MGSGWALVITLLTATSLLLGIGNTVWTWLTKGGAANAAKLKEIDTNLKNHDRRIQAVEGELKHLPSRDDLHRLSDQLTRVSAELEAFSRELRAVDRAVERIEQSMLEDKK